LTLVNPAMSRADRLGVDNVESDGVHDTYVITSVIRHRGQVNVRQDRNAGRDRSYGYYCPHAVREIDHGHGIAATERCYRHVIYRINGHSIRGGSDAAGVGQIHGLGDDELLAV